MARKKMTPKLLDELIDALEGLGEELPSRYSFEEDDDDGEGDREIESGHIESVEIEILLSAVVDFISESWGLNETPASFTELIEETFGRNDALVSVSTSFEDAINGYFGEIFGENLELSGSYLREIINELKRRRDTWKRKGKS